MSRDIVLQEEVMLDDTVYTEFTYKDGSVSYKRYNEKTKMWVTLNFAKEDNFDKLQQLHEICKDVFIQ